MMIALDKAGDKASARFGFVLHAAKKRQPTSTEVTQRQLRSTRITSTAIDFRLSKNLHAILQTRAYSYTPVVRDRAHVRARRVATAAPDRRGRAGWPAPD